MMFTPKDGFILTPTPELALDFLENRLNYRQLPLYISACITDVRVSYDAYEKTVDKYAPKLWHTIFGIDPVTAPLSDPLTPEEGKSVRQAET